MRSSVEPTPPVQTGVFMGSKGDRDIPWQEPEYALTRMHRVEVNWLRYGSGNNGGAIARMHAAESNWLRNGSTSRDYDNESSGVSSSSVDSELGSTR